MVEVDGATLRLGPTAVALGDVDDVRFERGCLVVISRRGTWWQTARVPWRWSHTARAFLVHWITEAARKARATEDQRRDAEARARRAMADLRARSRDGQETGG